MAAPTYKILVAGASSAGETCLACQRRERDYIPALGWDVCPLVFRTSRGVITFKVWDLAGRNEWLHQSVDGILAYCDPGAPSTCADALAAARACVLRARGRPRASGAATAPAPPALQAEALAEDDYRESFLSLARQLTGDPDLTFIGAPAEMPPCALIESAPGFAVEKRTFSTQTGAGKGYDAYPLYDEVEDALVEARRAGYDATVEVTVSFRKAAAP